MIKLSTGQDSTLGEYRRCADIFFGEKVVAYFDKLITGSPQGAGTEVLADERQMMILMASLMEQPHD